MPLKRVHNSKPIDSDNAELELNKGSIEAFNILYDKYYSRVYRFCLRMLGDESVAHDAFQETFINMYEHRMNFRGENFTSWLFTIARHTCLNYIRSRKNYEELDEALHSVGDDSHTDFGMKEFIEKSIAKLPVALREAFILRQYEECSYEEIAEILGITLSLAKVRVHRARLILQKMLKPLVKELYES